MEFITANWQEITVALLAVLGAASAIAKLTPTEADDKVINAILKVVHGLGLTKKDKWKKKYQELQALTQRLLDDFYKDLWLKKNLLMRFWKYWGEYLEQYDLASS